MQASGGRICCRRLGDTLVVWPTTKGGRGWVEPLPIVLISGLLTSSRLYDQQFAALWRLGR
jgi:pimeloyl-ACP methyl ester carboxylesterase